MRSNPNDVGWEPIEREFKETVHYRTAIERSLYSAAAGAVVGAAGIVTGELLSTEGLSLNSIIGIGVTALGGIVSGVAIRDNLRGLFRAAYIQGHKDTLEVELNRQADMLRPSDN